MLEISYNKGGEDKTSYLLLMAEILHQLIGSLSHYLQGFIHPRWLFGISTINRSISLYPHHPF